jgi:glucose/arabinose dehydrogenase
MNEPGRCRAHETVALKTVRAEMTALAGLAILAGAVRLAYLWDIPQFTLADEGEAGYVLLGLRIARGQALPLTSDVPYIGALWSYLLAALFLVGGPSMFSPRLLVMLLGALTVIPTYLLGRSFSSRRVGLLSAAMLAVSPVHIAVSSHLAWSHSITPLFTTLGLWLLHRAVTSDRPADLVWSGLAFGLALQTHPTTLLLIPGVALYAALARPAWTRTRWSYLAAGLALAACGSLLVAGVGDERQPYGPQAVTVHQEEYAGSSMLAPMAYLERIWLVVQLLTDSLGGVLSDSHPLIGPLDNPVGLVASLLSIVGLGLVARRGNLLPVLVLAAVIVLLPLVTGRYAPVVPKARYVAALLPLCYVAMAVALAETFAAAGALGRCVGSARVGRAVAIIGRVGVVLSALIMLAAPLPGLPHYYQWAAHEQRTNALLLRTIAAVEAARWPGEPVIFDRGLRFAYTQGGTRLLDQLALAGEIYGWPVDVVSLSRPGALDRSRSSGLLVVYAPNEAAVRQDYHLESVAGGSDPDPIARVFRADPTYQSAHRGPAAASAATPHSGRARAEVVASGVTMPANLVFAPDRRLFFSEVVDGRVRIVADGVLQEQPFVILPASKGPYQGVLGLALDPDFATNHWVYVFYSEADADSRPTRNRIVRFTERDGLATEPRPILDDLPINDTGFYDGNHNGGRLAVGPDGKLYVSLGAMARRGTAQRPDALNGKILRVNRDGTTPVDNPFTGLLPYAVGFRNSWGMAFHPRTGDLYVTDNGSRGYDEVNLVLPRGNYAYPTIEGGRIGTPLFTDPIWDSDTESLGITGMTFYTGWVFPEYRGDLFFCAVVNGGLHRLHLTEPTFAQVGEVDVISEDCRLDVADGPDGTLYFSDLTNIYRLVR